jgi:hypothetical protein
MASSLNSIAQVQAITNPRDALATYQRALDLRQAWATAVGEAGTYNNIGNLRSGWAIRAGPWPPSRALELATDANATARPGRDPAVHRRDRSRPRQYAPRWIATASTWTLKDTLFNQQNADRINRLQAAHEAQRREQQIALLEQERALGGRARAQRARPSGL